MAVFNGVDFRAFRPGLTTISVEGGSAYPAVSDFRWNVEVVTPRVLIDGDELVLATGASNSLLLYNRTILAGGSFRLRSSSPAVFRMRDPLNGATSDFTTDLRSTQILTLDVFGQAGDRAALIVSFPGFPDQTIPVRLVEPTLRPEARVKTVYLLGGAPVVRARINWTLEVAGSNPQFYYPQFRDLKPTRLRISDPSICSSPPQPENSFRSSFDLECSGLGEILVSLESEWRAEPVTVRVIPGPEQAVAPEPARVGYGLQSQVYRSWATSYRSSDTSQLRLSQNQLDPGQAETRGPSVWVQGLVASGQSRLIAEGNGKREEIPVYHFPSTMVARLRENNNSPSGEVRRSLTNDAGVLSVFPMLVEPATNSLLGSVERSAGSNLSLRGGWDPFFAAITSSNPNVAATVDSRVLLTEGRGEFSLPLQLRNYGQTTISVAQPEGFTSLPASTLRLTLAPEEIRFQPVLLAPELQTRVSVYNLPAGRRVTAESLDPAQLQLAQQELGPDAAQLSFDPVLPGYGLSLYARALPAAQPGETLRIRVTVEGQPPVEIPVMIGSLRIQPNWDTVRATPPFQTPAFLGFRIGPAVGPAIDAYWDGSVRPGGLVAVDIASSDSSRLRLSGSRIVFRQSFASVPVELLRPGTVRITATPAPTSASTQALGILEAPFAIGLWQHRSSSGALLSHLITPWLTVTNPSRERATFTLRNEGAVTALLGTVGGGVPRATTLSFTLDPGQSTQISATSGGPPAPGQQNRVQVRLTAQDFEDSVVDVSPGDSRAAFSAPSPLTIPRTQAALTGQVVLGGGFNLPSFPLAAPALFEIRSSNPQVIRGGTVAFQSGEATKSFSLAVAGPGDTVLTIAPPSSLSGMRGETLLVTVR